MRPPGVAVHTRPDGEQVATVWGDGMPVTAPPGTRLISPTATPEEIRERTLAGGALH